MSRGKFLGCRFCFGGTVRTGIGSSEIHMSLRVVKHRLASPHGRGIFLAQAKLMPFLFECVPYVGRDT